MKCLFKRQLMAGINTIIYRMCLLLLTNEKRLSSLNHFFFCGEILPHRTAKALVDRYPNAIVYNTYGPTEATVAVTGVKITPRF